jgi:chemotaxis protein CheD
MRDASDAPCRRINIVQGEQHVDADPDTLLTTILGSCVAACLWDAQAGIGGMNHFLLPGISAKSRMAADEGVSRRHGVHAMEVLVNGLLSRGAQRRRLQAKLFGGARMVVGLTDVGALNATFAEEFLAAEGIAVVGGSLRGCYGRRIQFWPVSGRARQFLIPPHDDLAMPVIAQRRPPRPSVQPGDLELF